MQCVRCTNGFYLVFLCILESAVGFRKKLTQANKEKFEQAAKFNEEVMIKSVSEDFVYLCCHRKV